MMKKKEHAYKEQKDEELIELIQKGDTYAQPKPAA